MPAAPPEVHSGAHWPPPAAPPCSAVLLIARARQEGRECFPEGGTDAARMGVPGRGRLGVLGGDWPVLLLFRPPSSTATLASAPFEFLPSVTHSPGKRGSGWCPPRGKPVLEAGGQRVLDAIAGRAGGGQVWWTCGLCEHRTEARAPSGEDPLLGWGWEGAFGDFFLSKNQPN